jgi:hypothetical protein
MSVGNGLRNGLSGGLWFFFVFIKFINHGGLSYLPAVVNGLTMAGTGNRCG